MYVSPGSEVTSPIAVVFRPISCSRWYIFPSETRSRAEVASSRMTSLGRFTSRRPNARRCCSPSERVLLQSKTASSPLTGLPSPTRLASSSKQTASNTFKKSSSVRDWRSKCDRSRTRPCRSSVLASLSIEGYKS